MASQTPIFVLDENLPFRRGKGVDGVKADVPKPAKPARHERKALRDLSKDGKPLPTGATKGSTLKDKATVQKALRDLSKDGKPLPTGATKGSTLKDKATVHGHENPKNASKNSFLTDEEIKKCHEWAKEGIEHAHFTGTEQRKLQKEKDEERVRKKVDKVMSALREWTDMAYNFALPVVDATDVTENIGKLELEPEVLPPRARSHLNSGIDKLEDLLLEPELDWYPFLDQTLEHKLKDDIDSK